MKLFKRNKRLLALEDYLGIFYVTDKWGDQEYKTEKRQLWYYPTPRRTCQGIGKED